MKKHLGLALVAVLISGASVSAQTLQFSLTDLGTFGGVSSDAKAVNGIGEIVGYYTTSTGQQKCFYWKSSLNGGYSTWASPQSGGTCIVYSINDNSIMAGTSTLTNGNYSAFSATRTYSCDSHRLCTWNINSTYLSSPYGLSTYGASIASGGIVVGSSNNAVGTYRASAWTNGTYSEFGGDTGWGTFAWQDCTGCFQVFGYSQITNGQTWAYDTLAEQFGPLSYTYVNTQVNAYDGDSNFVGWSYGWDNTRHAVLWSEPTLGTARDIGGPNSFATGILNLTDIDTPPNTTAIIGQWQGGTVPFLRETSGYTCISTVNLQTLLDSSGSGWTLLEANGIAYNNWDNFYTLGYIVGSARNSLGQTHAVRLTSNGGSLCP